MSGVLNLHALSVVDSSTVQFGYPDGSLWIFYLQPTHPFIVIEVALSHDYKTGFTKCMEWMRYFKGKIRYAVLIKTNQWLPKKKKNVAGKGKGEVDIAGAPANLQGKGKLSHQLADAKFRKTTMVRTLNFLQPTSAPNQNSQELQ